MIRRARTRVRSIFGNVLVRAHALITRATEPVIVQSPCQYYHLKKLLKVYYSSDVELVNEVVEFRSSPDQIPHIFHIRVGVIELNSANRRVTVMNIIAKILGHIRRDDREKKSIYFQIEREITMYKYIMPQLVRFERSWQLSDETLALEYFNLFPKCYGGRLSLILERVQKPDHSATILTENLKASGYSEIMEQCDIAVTELIVKHLARLHAIPLAMSVQAHGPYLAKVERRLQPVNPFKGTVDFNAEYNRICEAIEREPELNPYKPEILWLLHCYAENTHKDNVERNPSWITICHSKCSLRNIMYKSQNDVSPADIKFINLQDVELDSCCSDLIFFLLTSTSNDVLDVYLDTLLVTYFAEFNRVMLFNYLRLTDHTQEQLVTEFESVAESNVARILIEIRQIYFDGIDGNNLVRGTTYNTKIVDVLKFMIMRNWLKLP